MKSEIQAYPFRELTPDSQKNLNGGGWPIAVALVIAAAVEVIADWDNFKNGLMGRPEEK